MRVAISARDIVMPHVCACCGGAPETTVAADATRTTGTRVVRSTTKTWSFPYCNRCAWHVHLSREPDSITVLFLTLVTCGIYLFFFLRKRAKAKAATTAHCSSVDGSAAYLGWHGTVHAFALSGGRFALELMRANRPKLVDLDPVAREILARGDAADLEAHSAAVARSGAARAAAQQAQAVAAARRAAQAPAPRPQVPYSAPAPSPRVVEQPRPAPAAASYRPQAAPAVRRASATIVMVPPPRPILRVAAPVEHQGVVSGMRDRRVSTKPRFAGAAETLSVAGRTIRAPLTYVSDDRANDTDASTIVTSLPVGTAAHATPMSYWPRYAFVEPDQRAVYLDWMAGGRMDPDVPVGYVFIFFYGLERRVLVEGLDEDLARAEVTRLRSIYGWNRSFRSYSADFLAFTPLRRADALMQIPETELADRLLPVARESTTGLAAIAAWYCAHRRPLPPQYAAMIARDLEDAKRGVVVERSAVELLDLYSLRYKASFGEGILLEESKRPLRIEYRAASPTLFDLGGPLAVTLPNVVGKPSQFRPLVALWNDCVDDLRKVSARKAGRKALDAEGWAALPPELRAEYDHPDQDTWDAAIAKLPVLAGFHLARAGQLAELVGLQKNAKLTAAQMKRVSARAADVGYALEPDARVRAKAVPWDAELLTWRSESSEAPDAAVHGGVFSIVSLAVSVAMADGQFTQEEHDVVNSFLTEAFSLDAEMRARVEAMKQLVARHPLRVAAMAKLIGAKSQDERAKIGSVLVAIAAADGTIGEAEEKTLRALYKALGLGADALSAAIARVGARLHTDMPVEMQPADLSRGVPIPPPPGAEPGLKLDHAAIAAIVADTRDVAQMLAEVFDDEEDELSSASTRAPPTSGVVPHLAELPRASEATARLAAALDVRYHAVLEHLLSKDEWGESDVKELAGRHRLLPGAILDTINAWSDDALGDFLIEDSGVWKMNRNLAKAEA